MQVFLSLQLFQAKGLGALNHTATRQKWWTCSASQQRQPVLGWTAPEHRWAQPTRPQARFVLQQLHWQPWGLEGGGSAKTTAARSFLRNDFSIRVCPFWASRERKGFQHWPFFPVLVTLQEGQRACFACHWLLWLFHTTKRIRNFL